MYLGLIPRRTKSCRVSDPAERDPEVYQTPRNSVLRGIRPRRTMAELCTFYSKQSSAGYQTPRNKILRGMKPRRTTFKYEYFCKFETEFKNILGCEFGDYMGPIRGKNRRSKISCHCPFKSAVSVWLG
jgi:hypothetical protein